MDIDSTASDIWQPDASQTVVISDSEEKPARVDSSCTDALAQLMLCTKKLREAETQVRSLSLILEHNKTTGKTDSAEVDVLEKNRNCLQEEVKKLRQDICDQEIHLQQNDLKLFESYLHSINAVQDEKIVDKKTDPDDSLDDFEPDRIKHTSHWNNECSRDENEMLKLRRTLMETKERYKIERENIMSQLRALQVTTVNDETNWRCELREKQLKIEELTRKNAELQTKNEQLNFYLRNCEKLREKEAKESDKRTEKNEKVIFSLRTASVKLEEEKQQLTNELKELKRTNQESQQLIENLTEQNETLELNEKQLVEEKDKIVEEHAKIMTETNNLVNKLVLEISCLNTDNDTLRRQLVTNRKDEEMSVESNKSSNNSSIGTQTEVETECQRESKQTQNYDADLVRKLEEERVKTYETEAEAERWKILYFQNQRTIQELTISFGETKKSKELSFEESVVKTERRKENFLSERFEKIQLELNDLKKLFIDHKEKVELIQETWRKNKEILSSFSNGTLRLSMC